MSFVPGRGLHHFVYRCRDAEETRQFYEDILGLPLVHVIRSDHVASTGEYCPYVHIFFQMVDGSYIAFFNLGDDVKPAPSPNTPGWLNHLALRVDSIDALLTARSRLEAAGIEVLGTPIGPMLPPSRARAIHGCKLREAVSEIAISPVRTTIWQASPIEQDA